MNTIILTLLFDGALVILLTATIRYCSKLSNRIRLLQDSRSELAGMIAQFDTATQRATASLGELQTVSKKITDALQIKIEKANFLADDLAFLIEKSTKLATQLEHSKNQAPQILTPKKPAFPESRTGEHAKTQWLKPSANNEEKPALKKEGETTSHLPGSLEAVLQRLAAGVEIASPASGGMPPRTEAERELLEALKPGR